MDIAKILSETGLKDSHIQVYLACLELGSAPILDIAGRSGMPRSTCYTVLESLQRKGFVSSFLKKRVKYFSAEDPRKVSALLKERTRLFDSSLPQLMAMYGKAKTKPSVRFYEGKQGMKLILDEILDEAKNLVSFSSAEPLFYSLEFFENFVQERVRRKIPIRVIFSDSPKARERAAALPSLLGQAKIVSELPGFDGITFLYGEKVIMFSFGKELESLVIESKELSDMQKALFNSLWNKL